MKAIILCAGYGTRLGDLTRETPKPMLPINGKPLLEYILLNCKANGFTDIAINLHFKPEIITSYFGDGSQFGLSINYYYEEELLGTAGSILSMSEFVDNTDTFLVHYGDILTDQSFKSMYEFHSSKHDAAATLLVHTRQNSNSIILTNNNNRIIDFVERPTDDERRRLTSSLVNSGIVLFNKTIYSYIDKEAHDLPKDVYAKVFSKANLYAYKLESFRCAIDSPQRLQLAEEWIRKGRIG